MNKKIKIKTWNELENDYGFSEEDCIPGRFNPYHACDGTWSLKKVEKFKKLIKMDNNCTIRIGEQKNFDNDSDINFDPKSDYDERFIQTCIMEL